MSLIQKIKDYYKKRKRILFTTPSHSQGAFIPSAAKELLGKKYYKCDFSEIEGFDNLRAPEGVIKNLQQKISDIYQAKASFMLINGSTSGVISAMLACLKENDKVLIARNCHVSVYNGLLLSGADPIWFMPEFDNEWGIYKGANALLIEKHIKQHKDIKALIITSPTYEGLFSDVKEIANLCKKHEIIFIVDEAHGALLNFGEFSSKPAIQLGADISIQSLHKTAGAPNPCALLHIAKCSKISQEKLQRALNLINTTSPSYPMLAALEATVSYLNSSAGRSHIKTLINDIKDFINSLPAELKVYRGINDSTKILIKLDGVNAEKIAGILNKQYLIEEEYSTESAMLFITGIGTNKSKLIKLKKALLKITHKFLSGSDKASVSYKTFKIPEVIISPRKAYHSETHSIKTENAAGKIAGEIIIKYPPGIPVLLPGEIITQKHLEYIEKDTIKII